MLLVDTKTGWVDIVLRDFDAFLLDHAACERKASGMAMSMICHYPDRLALVDAMTDLALEELHHFRQVMHHVLRRKLVLPPDTKDAYVNGLRGLMRKSSHEFLLDRLLVASIVEARGHERFQLVADHVEDDILKSFYQAIARSEARHYKLFLSLAEQYFEVSAIKSRLQTLLEAEAQIVTALPLAAALH